MIIFRASISVSTSRTRHSPLSSLDRGLASAPSGDDTPRSTLSRHPLEHLYSLAQTTTHTLEFSLGYPLSPRRRAACQHMRHLYSTHKRNKRSPDIKTWSVVLSLLRAPPGVLITQHTHEVVHTHTHTLGSARDRSKEKLQVVLKSHTPHDPPPTTHAFCMQGGREGSPSTASHIFKREGACRAASRRPGSPHRARRGRRSTRGGGGRPSSRPRAFQCWGGGGWRRRAGC